MLFTRLKKTFYVLSTVLAATASFSVYAKSTADYDTLISAKLANQELLKYGQWSVATDPYGSTFSTTKPLINNQVLDVSFRLAAQGKSTEYPFSEVISKLPVRLTGAKTIEVTYRADKALFIKLSQADFSDNGDQSYAHYYAKVKASQEWHTEKLNIADFIQPKWAPKSAKAVPLNLNNVDAIYIAPDIDQKDGGKARIAIRSLVVN